MLKLQPIEFFLRGEQVVKEGKVINERKGQYLFRGPSGNIE